MTTLITGATGFLGSKVLALLNRRGEPVRIFARSPEKLGELGQSENVQIIPGDLEDPEAIYEAMRGVKRVYHIAAAVYEWVNDWSIFEQINVFAWENLVKAAMAAKVERIVYTSSFMALGPSDGSDKGDETLTHDPKHFHNPYEKTKFQGYKTALKFIESGAPIVIVCPGVIFGPGPMTEGNFIVEMIHQMAKGELPGIPGRGKTRWCFSFVEDVAKGHLAAMEKGRIGETYLLGGENKSLIELIDLVCTLGGIKKPKKNIPRWVMSLGAWGMELMANLTGKAPKITTGKVGVMKHDWAYSSQRAIRELDYEMTDFSQAVATTINWMREKDLL